MKNKPKMPRTLKVNESIRSLIAPLSLATKKSMYSDLMHCEVSDLTNPQIELLFALSHDKDMQSIFSNTEKKVKCPRCKWSGFESQLKFERLGKGRESDGIHVCPKCGEHKLDEI
jgi:hypothetical protein